MLQQASIGMGLGNALGLGKVIIEKSRGEVSMTTLLTHTVAHSTKCSFMPKTNNQPPKNVLSLALSCTKVVKNGKILTFKVNFLCQKISESF